MDAAPALAAAPPANKAVLHTSQNFAAGRLRAPQAGHFTCNGEAHSIQNLAPWRLSLPHFEHCILRTVGQVIAAISSSRASPHRSFRIQGGFMASDSRFT